MTPQEMRTLRPGDHIMHERTMLVYIVTATDGNHVTAVQTVDVTHPDEWRIILKLAQRKRAARLPRHRE